MTKYVNSREWCIQGVPSVSRNLQRTTAEKQQMLGRSAVKIIVAFQIETLARSPAPPIPRPPDRVLKGTRVDRLEAF
jgi:hypothetical protein